MAKDYKAPFKFCDLEEKFSSWEKSKVVMVPVSYDLTASYKPGTNSGPRAIIDASHYLETYDEETGKEIYKIGIYTAKEIKPINPQPEEIIKRVEEEVARIIKEDKFPVLIGGEHSITPGPVRAFKKYLNDFCVLQLDAHRDLRNTYQGSRYSHACIAKRIIEITSLVQVGIRSLSKEETLKEYKNLKTFFMKDVIGNKRWVDDVIGELETDNVYVTFDVDVLDPSIMPATGTPEPGGMGWYDILHILKKVAEEKRVIGFDVVELAPIPGNIAPDFLAAKLIYKFLSYIF